MTPTHDLAAKITTAVFDRIAADRLCNSSNIREAVVRELAVAALHAQPSAPLYGAGGQSAIDEAKRLVKMFFDDHTLVGATPRKVLDAVDRLYIELRKTGWHAL
jgi:hypothetical protein